MVTEESSAYLQKKFPGLPLEDPDLFHRVYVYRIQGTQEI